MREKNDEKLTTAARKWQQGWRSGEATGVGAGDVMRSTVQRRLGQLSSKRWAAVVYRGRAAERARARRCVGATRSERMVLTSGATAPERERGERARWVGAGAWSWAAGLSAQYRGGKMELV